MKSLKDSVSLKTEFEQITMTEFRSKPGEIMTAVELGKTFLIAKQGKPVAVLSPLPGELVTTIHPDGRISYEKPT